jgi:RNA 2',3'-cyclic 3'-phosphodiesterase
MRLFVAIDLDDRSRAAVAAEQERIRRVAEATHPRWTNPAQLHLTLAFLGEVGPGLAAHVQQDFAEPVALKPFDLLLGGVGVFPPHGAPRALWIGARGGSAELLVLQQELASRLVRRGIPLETRPFSPHLTIARWKASRPSDRRRVLQHATDRIIACVRIDHATLCQSRLSSQGATHTELARVALSGGSG